MPTMTTPPRPADGRNWPQSLRITRRERQLLRAAANRRNSSIADILRVGLDPLFARLATRFGSAAERGENVEHG